MRQLNRPEPFMILMILVSSSVLLALSGCMEDRNDGELDLMIVSIGPQKEVVERIAKEDAEIVVMVPENMEPHTYSPTPNQMMKVAEADIYFEMGSGIEFELRNMDTIRETNRQMDVVDMSSGIEIVSLEDHGPGRFDISNRSGTERDGTDPHIWMDPYSMARMADNVLEALIARDPENEEIYRANHGSYMEELNATIEHVSSVLDEFRGRSFLTYHPSFGYFADAFGLIQVSVQEEGGEPGPQTVSALIDRARKENITVVLVEPQFDSSSARKIADAIDGKVLTADPLASDYMNNLRTLAENLEEAFNDG